MDEHLSHDELFRIFVLQQQQTAMVFLGKMVHPQTNEIVRDLDMARFSIEMLAMLEAKTKGNLKSDEERLLGQVLTTLRLNYVEESSRPAAEKPPAEKPAAEEPAGGEASGGSAGQDSRRKGSERQDSERENTGRDDSRRADRGRENSRREDEGNAAQGAGENSQVDHEAEAQS